MCLGRITNKRYSGLFTLWQPSDQLSNILRHYVSDLHNFTNNMPALLLLDRNWFSSLCNSHPPLKLFFSPSEDIFDHVIQSFFQHELCYVMYRSPHPENSLYTLCGFTFSIILYQKSNKLSTYPLKCRKEADYIPCSSLLSFVNKGNILQVNLRSA